MQKGLEINFYDLFRQLLKKWAVVLTAALLVGLVANFYGYHKSMTAADKERQALAEYAETIGTTAEQLPLHMTAELAELRSALTEEEAGFVEAVAKLYMYRMWASDKINQELIVGEPDDKDLEIVQTLYYANEGVKSAIQVMTSAEKSYYNVLVKELSGTDMSVTEKNLSTPGILQPKWLVIGIVLGLLLGVCAVASAYILSGKLRNEKDIETAFGIPVLAKVGKDSNAALESVTMGIGRLMKEKSATKLAVCMTDTPEAMATGKMIKDSLEAKQFEVKEVLSNPDAFAGEISDADAVLFVEQIGKSRYDDIESHAAACSNYCVPTVGCVVIA